MAELRMREALRDALAEEMRRDEAVLIMGEDVGVFQGAFKVTEGLLDEFGERRVRDTPISENTERTSAEVWCSWNAISGWAWICRLIAIRRSVIFPVAARIASERESSLDIGSFLSA